MRTDNCTGINKRLRRAAIGGEDETRGAHSQMAIRPSSMSGTARRTRDSTWR